MSTRRVGLVTDSNSQLPPALAERYRVEIVPLTVTVDGVAHTEGVDLDADAFFARWAAGDAPQVSTAAPSPGAFIEAYERLAGQGVDEILSIHIGSEVSATLNAASLAVQAAPVPVRLVDTGTASFGVACCVWEAAVALEHGASLEAAAALAEAVAPTVGNVFVVGALDIVRAGGRLAPGTEPADGIPVLSLVHGQIARIGAATDVTSATDAMAGHVLDAGHDQLRVAIGIADPAAAELSAALEDRLASSEGVVEVVRYRIGPSVGAHTGPGTAGCFFWPPAGSS